MQFLHHIHRVLATLKSGDVIQCYAGNAGEAFAGKKALMTCDENIWKSLQTCEHIIINNGAFQVPKKRQVLTLVHIDTQIANFVAFQRTDDRSRIDEPPAARVLISMTSFFIAAKAVSSTRCRVCFVNGQCRLTISLCSYSSTGET